MVAAYKIYNRSQEQKKLTFLYKNELMLFRMFSTLYKNIFLLLLNVVDVEWMHTN